jgi:hypothetical protein
MIKGREREEGREMNLDAILAGCSNDLASVELEGGDGILVLEDVGDGACAEIPYLRWMKQRNDRREISGIEISKRKKPREGKQKEREEEGRRVHGWSYQAIQRRRASRRTGGRWRDRCGRWGFDELDPFALTKTNRPREGRQK